MPAFEGALRGPADVRKPDILAQRPRAGLRRAPPPLSPAQWIAVAVLGLCGGVAAFGIVPGTLLETVPTVPVSRPLELPAVAPLVAEPPRYWAEDRIQRGDTIGSVLARLGVDDAAAMAMLRSDPLARPLYQLRPGRPLRVETDVDGQLLRLRSVTGGGTRVALRRDGERFVEDSDAAAVDVRVRLATGEIRSSLFAAADAADLPDAVTMQLAEVFGGDIDFHKDLRRGDRFAVAYEQRMIDGEPQAGARILGAVFSNGGRTLAAYLWRADDGTEAFYSAEGAPLKKAFLRSPMEFSRITSGFSGARFHPILQVMRAHQGTDYAAPLGTPVRATGNGRVIFAGSRGGYGNVVELQHAGSFTTLYAHLSRFAGPLRAGSRVSQGEVIGYVGQTGWATGPHLHYEFRVGNVHRDPQTVALPTAEPVQAAYYSRFAADIAPTLAQIALAQSLQGVRLVVAD
jgi:murein DD-endopeptidase MepM/ murein hydrolase activator NlpD